MREAPHLSPRGREPAPAKAGGRPRRLRRGRVRGPLHRRARDQEPLTPSLSAKQGEGAAERWTTTMDCRDWLSTLWPGSYKGVPFFFESDDEEGGRGLIVHKFPGRDDPFVEDLGEEPRLYEGSIYISGDDVDAAAVSLEELLSSPGPGVLVVPIRGPVAVHVQTWKRHHEKDKLG